MAHLDDQEGKPALARFLDLSALKPYTKDEVQSALRKLPEMKLRPEKLLDEENVVFLVSWKKKDYPFVIPIPCSMLHVDVLELSKVDIDWKMLTLERPETPLEIQIFSRIVYLNKLTLKCIEREKVIRERAQSVRLRMKGLIKSTQETEVERLEEYTYEHFSRHFGGGDRGQAMEEVPKAPPPPKEEPKEDPANDAASKPLPNGEVSSLFANKKRKVRKRKPSKKKKKSRKGKKSKTTTASIRGRGTKKVSMPPTKMKVKKPKVLKKSFVSNKTNVSVPSSSRKKKVGSAGKTLIQILKSKEKAESKRAKEKKTD